MASLASLTKEVIKDGLHDRLSSAHVAVKSWSPKSS